MTQTVPKRIALTPDDRERMRRLSEEVRGRLQEMALITTRTLGIPLDKDTVVKFAPVTTESQAELGAVTNIEIVCGPTGCGCYVEPQGICEFPCGAAGPL
ncbi:MAG: hypothetical protein V7603_6465 [Micromonosporaceae bacterium]